MSRTGKAAPPGWRDARGSVIARRHCHHSAPIGCRRTPAVTATTPGAFGTGRRTGADGAGTAGGQERTGRERLADDTADATLSVEGSEPFTPAGWDGDGPTVM